MIDPIQITRDNVTRGFGYSLICSGYLIENDRVLLVHHNGFDKWVPPGGHVEPGETFDMTVRREFKEETGLTVDVVSATPSLLSDSNATPLPGPFYVDLEREGFEFPAIVQFFYVRRIAGDREEIRPQLDEVYDAAWFTLKDLAELKTFDQVRRVAAYALQSYSSLSGSNNTDKQ
ncbi:NUDIX hydrolase [Arthrobacter sp. NPDC058127]|uniref:NUDIX hydrolase n=1 Tax=Arthrobacter sp. NPDC058127 TaxID=3346351 RepID=UPI0036E91361